MAHGIYKEMAVFRGEPAWHGIGTVIQHDCTAVEAGRIADIPPIYSEPVLLASGLQTNHKAIVIDVATPFVSAVVSDDYQELGHRQLLELWDRYIRRPIETLGVLHKGVGMFVSCKAPTFGVKGDEVEAYIMAENWLSGWRANKVRKTPVRVVCWNTLNASDANFFQELRICHTKNQMEQFAEAMASMIDQAEAEYVTLKEAFELLASHRLTDAEARDKVFTETYPDVPQPAHLLGRAKDDPEALKKLAAWERQNGAQREHREAVYNLYAGEGRGSLTEAAAGTAWGAYNAVVEYEQYRKPRRDEESFMFGAGFTRTSRAYEACMQVAQNRVI